MRLLEGRSDGPIKWGSKTSSKRSNYVTSSYWLQRLMNNLVFLEAETQVVWDERSQKPSKNVFFWHQKRLVWNLFHVFFMVFGATATRSGLLGGFTGF